MSQNPYAPPEADVDAVAPPPPSAPAPALWNPNAAAGWSLLLTPAFGAFLHMKNWAALGEAHKADASRKWLVAVLAVFLVMTIIAAALPESRAVNMASQGVGIGMLVAWYFSSAREQMQYVLGRYGKTYPRRGWVVALLLGLAGTMAYFVLVFVAVALVFGLAPEGS
jgi:hypothetical protein